MRLIIYQIQISILFLGLTLERKDIHVWAASTPTGKREKFYEWCHQLQRYGRNSITRPRVNPNWDERDGRLRARAMFYPMLVMCMRFWLSGGSRSYGVYTKDLIDAARERVMNMLSGLPLILALRSIGVGLG